MKLVSRVLCFAVFVTVLRAGQASTVGAEYYAGGNEVRSTSGKLVGLESKIAIENNVLRKENMRLKQFLMQSSVLEKDASNNIDFGIVHSRKEQAPKLLCETFANSAVTLCKKQYVDCIKKAAESTSKKMTARSIRRMQQDRGQLMNKIGWSKHKRMLAICSKRAFNVGKVSCANETAKTFYDPASKHINTTSVFPTTVEQQQRRSRKGNC